MSSKPLVIPRLPGLPTAPLQLPALPQMPRLGVGAALTNIGNLTFVGPGLASKNALSLQSQKINDARIAAAGMPAVPQVFVPPDDEDMSGYVLDPDQYDLDIITDETKKEADETKKEVLKEPKHTPRTLSIFEVTRIIGARALRLQSNSPTTCPPEVIEFIQKSSVQLELALAAAELLRADMPIIIVRSPPTVAPEVLDPNKLTIKPDDREKVFNEFLPRGIRKLLRKK